MRDECRDQSRIKDHSRSVLLLSLDFHLLLGRQRRPYQFLESYNELTVTVPGIAQGLEAVSVPKNSCCCWSSACPTAGLPFALVLALPGNARLCGSAGEGAKYAPGEVCDFLGVVCWPICMDAMSERGLLGRRIPPSRGGD